MALVETEAKNFSRDMHNMALINTNVKAYQAQQNERNTKRKRTEKIINLEIQLQNLIKEVQEKLSKDTEAI